jgi:hypothetical protein
LSRVRTNIEPGSAAISDGWAGYKPIGAEGYAHQQQVKCKEQDNDGAIPGAHPIISLVKRLMLGTFQGRFEKRYLDEYTLRFNRRRTKHVGKAVLAFAAAGR